MPPEKAFETNTDWKGPLECEPPQFSFPFLSSQAIYNPTAPLMEAPLPAKMHDNCLSKTLAPGNFLVLLLLLNPHPSIISCRKKFFQDEPFPTETINIRFEKCVFNPDVCWQQIWGVRDITTCDPILSVSHRVCLWGIQQINCLAFHLYLLHIWMNTQVCGCSPYADSGSFKVPSVQFSCSVVSDSLWPHGPQHARPPSPSPYLSFIEAMHDIYLSHRILSRSARVRADLETCLKRMTTKLAMPILITGFRAFWKSNKMNITLINVN